MKICDKCRDCPFFPTEEEMDDAINFEYKYKKPYIENCGGIFKRRNLFTYEFGFNNNCKKNPEKVELETEEFLNKYNLERAKIYKEKRQ